MDYTTNLCFSPSPPRVLTPSHPRNRIVSRIVPPRVRSRTAGRARGLPPTLTVTAPSGRRLSDDLLTPLINVDGVESSTNELPLSAITFGAREEEAGAGRVASWPRLAGAGACSVWGAGRRQRHSIAGQMSYLKMLGLGARGKLSAAAGLFSTAVISGSSSAPNLRVMIPSNSASNGESDVPLVTLLPLRDAAVTVRVLHVQRRWRVSAACPRSVRWRRCTTRSRCGSWTRSWSAWRRRPCC